MKNTGIKIVGKEVLVSPYASIIGEVSYERKGSSTHGYYVFANTSCSIDVKIGDAEMVWCYQNGTHYNYGDYNCPTNSFELVDEGVIGRIYNEGYALEGEDINDEDLAEIIEALADIGLENMTVNDIVALYEVMVNFRPSLADLGISIEDDDFLYEVVSFTDEMQLLPERQLPPERQLLPYSDIQDHWVIERLLPKDEHQSE